MLNIDQDAAFINLTSKNTEELFCFTHTNELTNEELQD